MILVKTERFNANSAECLPCTVHLGITYTNKIIKNYHSLHTRGYTYMEGFQLGIVPKFPSLTSLGKFQFTRILLPLWNSTHDLFVSIFSVVKAALLWQLFGLLWFLFPVSVSALMLEDNLSHKAGKTLQCFCVDYFSELHRIHSQPMGIYPVFGLVSSM